MPLYNSTGAQTGSWSRPSVTGRYYPSTETPSGGTSFPSFTLNTMYVSLPRIAYSSVTIDQLVTNVNVLSSAGGVSRMGIYQVTTSDPFAIVLNSAYATLLVDAGTVATDGGGTGNKTITLGTPQVIPAGVAYCFAIVDQTAATTHRVRGTTGEWASPWGQGTAFDGSPSAACSVASVSGALPATFTPTAFANLSAGGDNAMYFRRSA